MWAFAAFGLLRINRGTKSCPGGTWPWEIRLDSTDKGDNGGALSSVPKYVGRSTAWPELPIIVHPNLGGLESRITSCIFHLRLFALPKFENCKMSDAKNEVVNYCFPNSLRRVSR